jgi:hypothetical protein
MHYEYITWTNYVPSGMRVWSFWQSVQDEKFLLVALLLASYREQSEEIRSVYEQRKIREFV